MIKVDKGLVCYEGTKVDILAELTHLINRIVKSGKFTKEDIRLCVDTAFKSDDEIIKEVDDKMEELRKKDPVLAMILDMID